MRKRLVKLKITGDDDFRRRNAESLEPAGKPLALEAEQVGLAEQFFGKKWDQSKSGKGIFGDLAVHEDDGLIIADEVVPKIALDQDQEVGLNPRDKPADSP